MGQKFYAVRRGVKPGIYRTWPAAQQQVSGYPGARYKSFDTYEAAQAFLADTATAQPAPQRAAKPTSGAVASADVVVYTDGGSRNTGNVAGGHVRSDDKAAWAYRIELADRMISDSAGEWGASNNRMEIMAFLRALQQLRELDQAQRRIRFVLDSRYVLNALTKGWLAGWKRRGWRRSAGPLANAELWQAVDRLLPEFAHLDYQWTKGHATNQGNVFVDHRLNQTMDHMTTPGELPPAAGPVVTTALPPKKHPAPAASVHPAASRQTIDQSVAAIRQMLGTTGDGQ